jgi:hypothetical protein
MRTALVAFVVLSPWVGLALTLWVAAGAVPQGTAAPPPVYLERACFRSA